MRFFLVISVLMLGGTVAFIALPSETPVPVEASVVLAPATVLPEAQAYLLPLSNPSYAPIRDTAIPDPIVGANVALVADFDSGRTLYEKNATLQVPIASLTKLVSAVVVEEIFIPEDIVTVASGSVRVDQLKQTLFAGERITVADLRTMMLVESSNDAAYALAAHAQGQGIDFIARMNDVASALGMAECRFFDPAGLDDRGHCTAHDLILLVRAISNRYPALWEITTHREQEVRSVDGAIVHVIRSTNELLGTVPGIVGGKTGNTDGALGCLLLLVEFPEQHATLISVVLGSQSRFTDTVALLDWAIDAYQLK